LPTRGALYGLTALNIYKNRRQGYLDALQSFDLPLDENLIIYSDMTLEQGMAGMKQLLALPTPPDGVFAASDSSVLGALQLLKSRGIRVPQYSALVRFSNEAFTAITEPMLTSVD
jgi:LacI family transcriptional regulator